MTTSAKKVSAMPRNIVLVFPAVAALFFAVAAWGPAARAIKKVGATHFAKAKDAFAPLGLLPQLAEGKVTPQMRVAIQKAEKLRSGLRQIHGEHRELVAGLKRLAEAAKEEGKSDYVRFAERLTLHIQEEEEVLYPAVLLVGDFVKWRLDKQ